MKQNPLLILVIFVLVSCADPEPSPTPRRAVSLTPTATATITTTPTLTSTPTSFPTSTSTSTVAPTSTPEPTNTPSALVESILQLVGNKPEDWISWNNEPFNAYAIKAIFPGADAVSNQLMILTDGDGKPIGEAYLTTRLDYVDVIGDNALKSIIIPVYWKPYAADGMCYSFGNSFLCSLLTPADFGAHKLMRDILGQQHWRPGQVVTIFINRPDQQEPGSKYGLPTAKLSNLYLKGRENEFDRFIHQMDDSIEVLIPGFTLQNCSKSDTKKYPDFCQTKITIIPGYK